MFSIDGKSETWKGIDLSFMHNFDTWHSQDTGKVYTEIPACQIVFVDGALQAVGEELNVKCQLTHSLKEEFILFTHIVCHTAINFTILYIHTPKTENHTIHYHNYLEILPGIQVTCHTRYQGKHHFLQICDVVKCHAQAELNYLIDSHETPQISRIIHQLQLELEQHSLAHIFLGVMQFSLHSFILQGELQGYQAQLYLKGIAYIGQTACNHRILNVNHRSSKTLSSLQLLTCTTDNARFIAKAYGYNAEDLQELEIQQKFKGVIMSDASILSFVPSLKIHAGDVKAHHSVAIYTLQKQSLWYLQTRGLYSQNISHTVVMNMLIGGLFPFQDRDGEDALLRQLVNLLC